MMRITEVTVAAGRKFNHPYESYSNLSPLVSMRAEVQEGEDAAAIVKDLQARAEELVENHKQHLLDSLHKLQEMEQYQARVLSLESRIRDSQAELERVRQEQQKLLPKPYEGVPASGQEGVG